MELKEILYSSIHRHSDYIISDIAQGRTSEVIDSIFEECKDPLDQLSGNKSENIVSFAEALVHYLLTTALIPSQRKITFNKIYVDMLIPDIKILKISPQDALIIIFQKSNDLSEIKSRLAEIIKLQPNKQNIWFVSERKVGIETKSYVINYDDGIPFSKIIDDIIAFLTNKKQSKLKIFKI